MNKSILKAATLAVAAAYIPFSADALTVDDLDGKLALQAFQGNLLVANHFNATGWGVFHKVEGQDNILLLDNFYNCPAYFRLKDDTLFLIGSDTAEGQKSETKDGTDVTIEPCTYQAASGDYCRWMNFSGTERPRSTGFSGKFRKGDPDAKEDFEFHVNLCFSDNADEQDCIMFRQHSDDDATGVGSLPEDGREKIRDARRKAVFDDYMRTFRAARLYVFTSNDVMSFYDGSEKIPVRVIHKTVDNNYYTIIYNFGGFGWNYYFDGEKEHVDNAGYYETRFDLNENTLTCLVYPLSSHCSVNVEYASETTTTFVKRTGAFTVGSYVVGDQQEIQKPFYGYYHPATPAHSAESVNRWHPSDGGDLVTTENAWIDIDPWAIRYQNGPNTSQMVHAVAESRIDFKADVTHDAILSLTTCEKATDGKITIDGTIGTERFGQYVDSHELMLAANYIESLDTKLTDPETGLAGARSLATVSATQTDFNVVIDPSTTAAIMPFADDASHSRLTLFVKTNYTTDSGLESSFHQLKPIVFDTSTGIGATVSDKRFDVKAGQGYVDITGDGHFVVTSPQGTTIYAGGECRLPLPAGVYIVSQADSGDSVKIIIK